MHYWLTKILSRTCLSEPAGAPRNVQGRNSSSNSILVTWSDVPAEQQNGIITGYNITYHSQTENDNGSVQVNDQPVIQLLLEQTKIVSNISYHDFLVYVLVIP